jgi:hypothetical protein
MLMLKLLISYAIPDIPSWVATEMAKIEYHRREIEKASSFAIIQTNGQASEVQSISQSLETDDKSVQVCFVQYMPLNVITGHAKNNNIN